MQEQATGVTCDVNGMWCNRIGHSPGIKYGREGMANRQTDISMFSNRQLFESAGLRRYMHSQQGGLRLSGSPLGQCASGGARTSDRKVPVDLRADSLATVPPTPL
ncbi:hypothetical protein PoB_006427000 [Plakobranchus ocellatus]|uniref:Uncharacterized protein n=1 Tax=Plakobranchus ocellatus TaxID=259542 RepID=A0AAV4D0X4_9GAST|nr:hypothetical protein PoB_006427000 [Plakobranchus ocellatus]